MQYIAYYRVSKPSRTSKDKKGYDSLGLEAQQIAVNNYLRNLPHELLGEYVEVETAKKCHVRNRPQLREALAACKKHKATLIIAKLDRLARNTYFITGLMESNVNFIATDNPHANKTMIQMMAVFAEHEREQISLRTKSALAVIKRNGKELGKHGKVLAKINAINSQAFAETMKPTIQQIMDNDIVTYKGIAAELNKREIPTYRPGSKWHAPNVFKMMNKIGI